MKRLLLIAAFINAPVAIIHTFIGETDIIAPLTDSDAPMLVKATLHSAWHMISVMLYLSSVMLFYVSRKGEDNPQLRLFPLYFGIQYISLSLVFVVTSILYGQFFPQIVMLAPIGLLALWAGRQTKKQSS